MLGTGTLGDPYIIQNVTDLQNMNNDLDAYYELGNDIDASATSGWNGGAGFNPVGNYNGAHPEYAFSGRFDGKGYTITALFIYRPSEDYVGLFGYTAPACGGWIRNGTLADVDIEGGDFYVGALVGFHEWNGAQTVTNCHASGSVKGHNRIGGIFGYNGSDVTDCSCSCDVSVTDLVYFPYQIAGFVGRTAMGTLTRCFATGNITVSTPNNDGAEQVGGFLGYRDSGDSVECYSTGSITITVGIGAVDGIGGFAGTPEGGSSIDCYSRGAVTVITTGNCDEVGGFVGGLWAGSTVNCYSTGLVTAPTGTWASPGGFCSYNGGTITNCFWNTETSGQTTSDGGIGKTTAQMKNYQTFLNAGWGMGSIWGITSQCNDGYPCLINVQSSCVYEPFGHHIVDTDTTKPSIWVPFRKGKRRGY